MTSSIFGDLFSGGYKDAAAAQSAGLTSGYAAATPLYGQARSDINTNYAAALAPYTALGKTAAPGVAAYGSAVMGDPAAIQKQLEASPGYQFNLTEGLKGIDRGAAARGLTTSGNTLTAEQKFGAGLASNTYQNYLASLAPYFGVAENAAAGTAGVATGQGNQLAGIAGNQGNLAFNTQAGIGAAQAGADINAQNAQNSFISGITNLGGKLLGAKIGGGGTTDPTTLPNAGFGTRFFSGGYGVT